MRLVLIFVFFTGLSFGQTNSYKVSFTNPIHHEAVIEANFRNIQNDTLVVEMSRSSPGRYAIHEFAKNVYNLSAVNSKGDTLKITRPDPYSWKIAGAKGDVKVTYTLFANHADGTYSQVDDTHAHLNMPATFIFSRDLQKRPIEVKFDLPKDLNWKVATQLKEIDSTTFSAPNMYYFMDSPVEISDFALRSFMMDGQEIRFVLHHPGTDSEVDQYFEQVKKVVEQEKLVYGELPKYDFGKYTFLACYMPNVSGDGMEHRNSTILTDVESLADGGMAGNIGTVSHEYFHSWNVERIRPTELEPFDFTRANMSGALWFAEGFTSYYTNLILERAGIITAEDYVKSLNGTFNYVWNSPARTYFNPIEMSFQAPFVDAATSVDEVNRENTFISYYSYGSVLGLALDLNLREKGLNLDDFMKLMWTTYGKSEKSYMVKDIEATLETYAGKEFATNFFSKYIYNSQMPNYNKLLEQVGLKMEQLHSSPYFGVGTRVMNDKLRISGNPRNESPAYNALLTEGDEIVSVNGKAISTRDGWTELMKNSQAGETLDLTYMRNGKEQKTQINLTEDPTYTITINSEASKKSVEARNKWLATKK